jgi:hypothetical protein
MRLFAAQDLRLTFAHGVVRPRMWMMWPSCLRPRNGLFTPSRCLDRLVDDRWRDGLVSSLMSRADEAVAVRPGSRLGSVGHP